MTVRQHSFYLDDEDWKSLRHYCLDHGMSVSAFVAQAAREAISGKEAKFRLEASVAPPEQTHSFVSGTTTISTATGAPAAIPYNPVRAVPKPAPRKSSKTRVKA